MGNALEFIMKLVDQLSPAMRSAAAVTDSSTTRIAGDLDRVTARSRVMGASINDLRDKLEAVNKVRMSTRIADQFSSATREARRLEQQITKLEGTGKGGGVMSMVGGALGAFGITGGIGAAVSKSADAEMSKVAFSTLLGSKGKGNAMYSDLNKFANDTVFDNAGVYKNAQTLLAFGTAGDKVMSTMRMLGDVSMGDQQKMESLTLAFAQVGSAGKLSGQDLLQFVNAGFNPLNEITKATGIKMADLRKQMEKGAITSDMVNEAFKRATGTGGMFHNALSNAADTVTGKWGVFMGTVATTLVAFGDYLKPLTKWVLDFGNAFLSNVPVLLTVISIVGILAIAVNGLSWYTKAWAFAQGILNAVMAANPIVLIIGAIALLATWVIYAYNHFGTFRGIVQGAWEGLKAFGTLIKDFVIDMIMGMVRGVTGIGEALMYFFKGDWSKAWETGKNAAKDLVGVNAIGNAIDNGKKLGEAVKAGYANGVSEIATKNKGKGVNPVTANGAGAGAGLNPKAFEGLGNGSAKASADKINSGGQRSIVINIGKQIEKLELHTVTMREGVDEMGKMIREELVRVLQSVNGMQTSGA